MFESISSDGLPPGSVAKKLEVEAQQLLCQYRAAQKAKTVGVSFLEDAFALLETTLAFTGPFQLALEIARELLLEFAFEPPQRPGAKRRAWFQVAADLMSSQSDAARLAHATTTNSDALGTRLTRSLVMLQLMQDANHGRWQDAREEGSTITQRRQFKTDPAKLKLSRENCEARMEQKRQRKKERRERRRQRKRAAEEKAALLTSTWDLEISTGLKEAPSASSSSSPSRIDANSFLLWNEKKEEMISEEEDEEDDSEFDDDDDNELDDGAWNSKVINNEQNGEKEKEDRDAGGFSKRPNHKRDRSNQHRMSEMKHEELEVKRILQEYLEAIKSIEALDDLKAQHESLYQTHFVRCEGNVAKERKAKDNYESRISPLLQEEQALESHIRWLIRNYGRILGITEIPDDIRQLAGFSKSTPQ